MKPNARLLYKWNCILKAQRLDAIQPGKPNCREQADQKTSKKKGMPEWARWDPVRSNWPRKGSRK